MKKSFRVLYENGESFIAEETETRLKDRDIGCIIKIKVIDVSIPHGADKDKNFLRNIKKATNLKEIKEICKSWKNI